MIKRLKDKRFRPAAPLRKNRLCAVVVGIGAQEFCHAFGRILSIGIHHDYGVAAGGLLNVYQPDGDCPLVPRLRRKRRVRMARTTEKLIWKSLRSHLFTEPSSTRRISILQSSEESLVNPTDQFRGGQPVIPERH